MSNKISLITQALSAAESSIKLARQLLNELESHPGRLESQGGQKASFALVNGPVKEKPGVVGIFDGENMVTETGEKYLVPTGYASKSMLVVGDTLKMIEEEEGEKRFKQVEHVKRHRTTGILTKKEGKFRVVTPEGSYKVLPAAVEHFKGDVGDEVTSFLPAGNLMTAYSAIESLNKKSPPSTEAREENKLEENKKEEKKEKESKPREVKVSSEGQKNSLKENRPEKEVKTDPLSQGKKEPEESVRQAPTTQVVEIKMPQLAEDELR